MVNSFIVWVKASVEPEDEDTTIVKTVGNFSPEDQQNTPQSLYLQKNNLTVVTTVLKNNYF
jgi:hypothetical protein